MSVLILNLISSICEWAQMKQESVLHAAPVKTKDCCCFSIQGLHPSNDSVFVVYEGESFGETLLTTSAVVKWDVLAFGAFPGCVTSCFTLTSWFLPPRPTKVTIYAKWCRHFSLSFFFSGVQRIFVYMRPWKDDSGASSKNREKKAAFVGCIWRSLWIVTAFARCCDVIGLRMRPLKDADPELRHSKCVGQQYGSLQCRYSIDAQHLLVDSRLFCNFSMI